MRRAAVAVAVVVFACAVAVAYHTNQARASDRTVALGDSGPQVTQAQAILAANGYTVTVDGRFGPQTQRAVRHWQQANGLVVDGVVGPATWATLRPAVRLTPPQPRTPEQIIRAVFPDDIEDRAVAIAWRESRFVPTAANACCYGLFQINYGAHRSWLASIGVTSPQQLLDPNVNVFVAYGLYQAAGWGPWSL